MTEKNIAVILSGCGVCDGAEINEVVLTLLALEQNEVAYQCFAPDINQSQVVDHTTGSSTEEKRNVLKEAARIVRGKIKPLTDCCEGVFSAVILPGGFGVAKNLSTFALEGQNLKIDPAVFSVLNAFKDAGKPAGYMCIAPVLLPLIYGKGVELTIGNDKDTISVIERLGGIHKTANVDEIVTDKERKVVTTPAYMLAKNRVEAKSGIDKLVTQLIALC